MKIAIRMDDITPDMDWAKFMRFKALCDQYGIRPLVGVVPDNQDENLHMDDPKTAPADDFWNYLKQLEKEGWCIAQHGVTHVYATKRMGCFPLNRLSEFAGLSYEKQYQILKEGKKILLEHDIRTELFMAPAHSYDRNTIKALRKLGFRRMTDGFGAFPYIRWGMTFYPISYQQGSALKKTGAKGYTTFVVHTNTMNDKDFARYEQLFATHRDRFVSYANLLELEPHRRGAFRNIQEYLMAALKFCLVGIKGRIS